MQDNIKKIKEATGLYPYFDSSEKLWKVGWNYKDENGDVLHFTFSFGLYFGINYIVSEIMRLKELYPQL